MYADKKRMRDFRRLYKAASLVRIRSTIASDQSKMSSTRTASSSNVKGKTVTTKSWFLTLNEDGGDVFIWIEGARLKLRNGQSAGRVRAISVLNAEEKSVTVSNLHE